MKWLALFAIIIIAMLISTQALVADIATGGANITRDSLEGTKANPANAGRLKSSEIGYKADFFGWKRRQIKYPGQKLYTDNGLGFKAPIDIPQIAVKLSPSFGITGFLVPPLPIAIPIDVEEVPIYILGTVNYVDVHIKAKTTGFVDLSTGFELIDGFALGARLQYLGFEAEGYATPTNSSDHLIDFKATGSTTTIGLGLVLAIVKGVDLGATADVLKTSQTNVDASVAGIGNIGEEEGQGSAGQGGGVSSNPLAGFGFGLGVEVGSSTKVYFDGRYTRADPNKTTLSIVDLKEKKVDSYDKLGVSLGINQQLSRKDSLQFGGRYEPASIGAGSPGEDGKVGYGGSFDQLINIVRGGAFEPYYQIEFGYLGKWAPVRERSRGKKRRTKYYQGEWGIGVSYLYGAAGIGPEGELPAAYEHTELSFPISLKYKL